jgi:nicotinamidase-related amidase
MIWVGAKTPHRRIVIDVDTQNHFFLDDGPVCVRDHKYVLKNIKKILAWARSKRIDLISTMQVSNGTAVYANSFLAGGFSVGKPSCTLYRRRIQLDAQDCTDLPDRVLERYDQVIFHKRCHDPFAEPRIDRLFTEVEADEFVILGAPTEGAVKATALGLLARGKQVTVVVDATGPLSQSLARKALQRMKTKGAKLVNTDKLLGGRYAVIRSPHMITRGKL